ncbi:MAG: hypothetical protein ACC628_00725 [Pirellulaceae bacterium]
MTVIAADVTAPQRISRLLTILSGAGGVAFLLGLLITPNLVWPNLLLMCFYMFGLGLGATLFLALTRLMGAQWCRAIQIVPESMAKTIPLVAPLLGVVVIMGAIQRPLAESAVLHGESFWFKSAWLSTGFFAGRTVFYLVVFSLLSLGLASCSRRSRETTSPLFGRLSALFMVVFAIVFSAASVDWIQALDPDWFSTMWGVYQFSGVFVTGLATITLLAILLEQAGPLQGILTKKHLHTLGILLFSFSSFWMYIWLCQYMLIWYANISEETFYFFDRSHGLWGPLFIANLFLNWLIPFLVLLPRPAKQSASVLWKVAVVILVGRWLDLYIAIIPARDAGFPLFGFCEVGGILGTIGLFGLLMLHVLRKDSILA